MLSDLRFTWRGLQKAPGFVAIAVFTLALGIAVNTTMFSIVNAVLFRALPYADPAGLVAINLAHLERGDLRMALSRREFEELRAEVNSLTGMFAMQSGTFNVSGGEVAPERFSGVWMTGLGLQTLGAQPQLGRWWSEDEDRPGAGAVVVISEKLWQTRFGARPDVLGQTLKVNGEVATVIGVAAGRFDFPAQNDLWMPLRQSRADEKRDNRYLDLTARLAPGRTAAEAAQEIGVIFRRWAQDHPREYENLGIRLVPLREDFLGDDVKRMLAIMTGAVTMVLLIACANVANLLLVRGGVRAKEVAIRTALGASRGGTVRLLLLESLLLALGGAVCGLPLAHGLLQAFAYAMTVSGDTQPSWLQWTMDGRVLLYVLGTVVFSCVVAGLVPAWRISRPNLGEFLKDGSRGSTGAGLSRLTRGLVIAEVAFSCVLLVASGLMIRSVQQAARIDLGYEPAGVMTARIGLPETTYPERTAQRRFFHDLLERVQQRPEVTAAALSSRLPTWDDDEPLVLEVSPLAGGTRQPRAGVGRVSPGWFGTLGVQVRQGRDFDARDTAETERVAIVNERLAADFWPGADAIGRRFKVGRTEDVANVSWVTVVGVVPTIYQGDFEEPAGPQIYLPQAQGDGRYFTLMLRTARGDPTEATAIMREEVRRLDPDLPIYFVRPLQRVIDEALFFKKLFAWIFGIFGGVAVVLAGVGLYGVMAYSVSQRTQEIGVRMALGAQPRDVVVLVLRQGGGQLGIGLAVGLTLAWFAGRLLQFILFDVKPGDPLAMTGTLVTLGAAGLLACVVPALRAVRVSPIAALRDA